MIFLYIGQNSESDGKVEILHKSRLLFYYLYIYFFLKKSQVFFNFNRLKKKLFKFCQPKKIRV
jgi:hypothetical protein